MKSLSATLLALAIVFAHSPALLAATVYVAPGGDDANAGSIEKPFASIQHAQQVVSPGDTVFIRGGTYAMQESQVAQKKGIYARVFVLDKSGEPEKRINYFAYENEKPVFDFSAVKPADLRISAFYVSGSWVHIKGLEVIGVQVTLKVHTQSICFENDASNNIYEMLSMHDGMAIGLYSVRGSNNLFLNCDAYRNHDPVSEDGKGGNVDGFGCHPSKGSTGNVFRGCRAWFNSDDGYDCINSFESVTFENCWAFYNGYSTKFEKLADGNGFKGGGYGTSPVDRLPNPIPRHTIRFCLAVHNRSSGFYGNHHIGGSDWFNNTAFNNGANFNLLARLADNKTDVPGYGHTLHNNLSFKSRALVTNLDTTKSDAANNSFTLDVPVSDKDFESLDEAQLVLPRKPDGSLPEIKLMHLTSESALIDKGVELGFPYRGKKPDLGAFEK